MAIHISASWDEPQPQLNPLSSPPEDFDGLGVEAAVKLIEEWFFTNFEDPAHNTPYESSEGGYQYIWGGPYEAGDVIRNTFAGVASAEIINAAVKAIENEGFLWVPNERRIQPPDDWVDLRYVPDDQHGIFMDSYHDTGEILANHGSEEGSNLINRMLFAQQVSALEAYLSDTLLKAIAANKDAMKRLIIGDKYLHAVKYTLSDIINNRDLVAEKVNAYLRSLVYHDLARIDFLYWTALGVRVLRKEVDKAKLFEAITYRHDCVHRNGLTKDGIRLTVFTKSYVQEIADVMCSLVDQIDNEIHDETPF